MSTDGEKALYCTILLLLLFLLLCAAAAVLYCKFIHALSAVRSAPSPNILWLYFVCQRATQPTNCWRRRSRRRQRIKTHVSHVLVAPRLKGALTHLAENTRTRGKLCASCKVWLRKMKNTPTSHASTHKTQTHLHHEARAQQPPTKLFVNWEWDGGRKRRDGNVWDVAMVVVVVAMEGCGNGRPKRASLYRRLANDEYQQVNSFCTMNAPKKRRTPAAAAAATAVVVVAIAVAYTEIDLRETMRVNRSLSSVARSEPREGLWHLCCLRTCVCEQRTVKSVTHVLGLIHI